MEAKRTITVYCTSRGLESLSVYEIVSTDKKSTLSIEGVQPSRGQREDDEDA